MDDILELLAIWRNSASRQMTTYVEASGRLLPKKMRACFGGLAGLFRVGKVPLARRRLDALPSEQASIDRP